MVMEMVLIRVIIMETIMDLTKVTEMEIKTVKIMEIIMEIPTETIMGTTMGI